MNFYVLFCRYDQLFCSHYHVRLLFPVGTRSTIAAISLVEETHYQHANGKISKHKYCLSSEFNVILILLSSYRSNSAWLSFIQPNCCTANAVIQDGRSFSHCRMPFSSTSCSTISTKNHTYHQPVAKGKMTNQTKKPFSTITIPLIRITTTMIKKAKRRKICRRRS